MQLDRQTDWLITRLSSKRVRQVEIHNPSPSPLHAPVCLFRGVGGVGGVTGLLRGPPERAQLGQTANLGWGDGVRTRPGWFKGQSVGYMFVQFLKGRRAPCTS